MDAHGTLEYKTWELLRALVNTSNDKTSDLLEALVTKSLPKTDGADKVDWEERTKRSRYALGLSENVYYLTICILTAYTLRNMSISWIPQNNHECSWQAMLIFVSCADKH